MNYNVILWTQFEISVVPIGRGFSFFWSWKSYGKLLLQRVGTVMIDDDGMLVVMCQCAAQLLF